MAYCLINKFKLITVFDKYQEGVLCLCNIHKEKFQPENIASVFVNI